MTHLDEGQILALRDDPTAVESTFLAHLHACDACSQALEETRRRGAALAAALGSLDDTTWDLDQARDRIRRRVAEESARVAGAPSLTARRARRAAWGWSGSKAAGLLLVTAAGLSALPGSPVRRWIAERAAPAVEEAVPAAETAPTLRGAEEGGVRLPLSGGPLTVVLRDAAPGTEVRVRWIPGREAALFAPAGSRFTSGQGRMEAAGLSGVVRLELPSSVLPVSLELNGRIILRNSGAGLDVSGPVVQQTDAEITFRLPPR